MAEDTLTLWYEDESSRKMYSKLWDKVSDYLTDREDTLTDEELYEILSVMWNMEEDIKCLMQEVNDLRGDNKYTVEGTIATFDIKLEDK
jgi:hypothetical protein